MGFVHEHPDYPKWLRTIAEEKELAPGLVEKDYWVTHTLWSPKQSRCELWFKGGTSLSKAFGLVTRFSEDIDVRLEHPSLPAVSSWTSDRAGAVLAGAGISRA
ncbi:MAG: nucleotidyl transferase AbiEii/AbiGii toxin family protein [Deltaproteobacteria bacterium]|nr:nucleotidyl transferase AbiEii/AbiGii toxin family protein [Deltaproteobacteria bacterium]